MSNLEMKEYQCRPIEDEGEVSGHAVLKAKLLCYDCRRSFEIKGHPRDDVYYCCPHCNSLNCPDLSTGRTTSETWQNAPSRPPGSYSPPKRLDTVFLRDGSDRLFEIPRREAKTYEVTSQRLNDLGHPPFFINLDRDYGEVAGHDQSSSTIASGPGSRTYHNDWQQGCYLDNETGQFLVGIHRHPYGDERAVGVLQSDFT